MGWRALSNDQPLYDVMRDLAQGDDPVGVAVIERDDSALYEPHLYGAAFGGVPASHLMQLNHDYEADEAQGGVLGPVLHGQLAVLAVCTAHFHGRKAAKEAGR